MPLRKPSPPPFRPLFLAGIGMVAAGKTVAHLGDAPMATWIGAGLGVVLGVVDVFRWFHQQALHDARGAAPRDP